MAGVAGRWRRARRILKRALTPHALILMYHRVADLDSDPHLLAVTPGHFAAHLEVIRRHGVPVALNDLVEGLKGGRVPRRAVAVTFDDGYADNLEMASPLLEHEAIPATIFVTTGLVGGRREFWWDELDRLLLQPGLLPAHLRLEMGGTIRQWDLGPSARYSPDEYQLHRLWHIERGDQPTTRHGIFMDIFSWLLTTDPAGKEGLLADLRRWADTDATARLTHRPLTESELATLSASSLIDIGAHTVSHPALGALSAEEQRVEITGSKSRLESLLGTPVTTFALPHGSSSSDTPRILVESGFTSVCTSNPDAVWSDTKPLALPRVGVRDMDGGSFETWFRWWMEG